MFWLSWEALAASETAYLYENMILVLLIARHFRTYCVCKRLSIFCSSLLNRRRISFTSSMVIFVLDGLLLLSGLPSNRPYDDEIPSCFYFNIQYSLNTTVNLQRMIWHHFLSYDSYNQFSLNLSSWRHSKIRRKFPGFGHSHFVRWFT